MKKWLSTFIMILIVALFMNQFSFVLTKAVDTNDDVSSELVSFGDVNNDTKVDAKDALMVLKYAVQKIKLNPEQQMTAEVDGNIGINAKDALEILKYSVGKIDGFPIELWLPETPIDGASAPRVVYSFEEINNRDMFPLENGGFVVAGERYTDDWIFSTLQIYDDNLSFVKEYSFRDGNGFTKIVQCSDGGFIATSYCPPCITKINSHFEPQWIRPYEDVEFEGIVHDIEEISSNLIAVLFVTINSNDFSRHLKLSYLDGNGERIETVDLGKNIDPQDAEIVADGKGGFYVLSTCNQSLANEFPLVAQQYESTKGTEAIIMHLSADREMIWAKTFGGMGSDWIEESTIDSNGNLYLAMATNWNDTDSFWDMPLDSTRPNRRMLIKVDFQGNLVYKVPLANHGMVVDQVFGIHTMDGKTYVVGMAEYYDGYQEKYPCAGMPDYDSNEYTFSVYILCIDDETGEESKRNVFRCSAENSPSCSIMLKSGSIVMNGTVSGIENYLSLPLTEEMNKLTALFMYAKEQLWKAE